MTATATVDQATAEKNLAAGPYVPGAKEVLDNYYKNHPTSTPAPAPTTPDKVGRYPTGSPPASNGQTYVGVDGNTYNEGSSGNSPDSAETAYLNSTKPQSMDDILSSLRDSSSGTITAIKGLYSSLLADQAPKNAQNEGRTRGAAAATGTLGTDFGNGAQRNAEQTSMRANDTIISEEADKLASLDESMRGTAGTIYSAETAAKKDNVAYQKQAIADTQARLASIAASKKLDDLTQGEYDSLYAHSGFNSAEEFNTFYEASRVAALQGTKLVGDASTGFYMPTVDSETGAVGYKNVIKPIIKPTQYGAFQLDPNTGEVITVAPAAPKIITSGGRIWSIDPKTNAARPLTAASSGGGKVGWERASIDQQLAAQAWIEQQASVEGKDASSYLKLVKTNPDAFLQALNGASEAGIYVPATVSTSGDSTATEEAAFAAQNAADAADNSANNAADSTGTDTSS